LNQSPHASTLSTDAAAPALEDSGSWWTRPSGGREVLILALPMVISTSFTSVMHFIDRMFLTWHSSTAMAASMQAGLAQWTLICFAFGVASYVNSFVAQYHGAGHDERIGASVWQGIWFGILLSPLFLLAIPLAPGFFALVGHDPALQREEVLYFQILAWASGPTIIATAMSTFFTGRGQMVVTMIVSGIACAINIIADYFLIFDKFDLGVEGIAGAAYATVLAHWSTVVIYALWMYQKKYRQRYRLTTNWRFDPKLMLRLIYFGGSSGLQMLIEGAGFTVLLLLVGRLGKLEAEATTLAFNINIVAFIPMVGLGIAISTLVGQQLGQNRPDLAERATWTGLTLGMLYSSVAALLYFAAPDLFLMGHAAGAHWEGFQEIRDVAVILLRFVALYFLFDTMQIVFVCALKGAGDTLFVLFVAAVVSITGVAVGQLGAMYFGGGLYWWWSVLTGWLFTLAMCYLTRFLHGDWKKMRVIEQKYLDDASLIPVVDVG
jgi:MATE family multidrug resistance protein